MCRFCRNFHRLLFANVLCFFWLLYHILPDLFGCLLFKKNTTKKAGNIVQSHTEKKKGAKTNE